MRSRTLRILYVCVVLCGAVYAFETLRGPNGIPGLLEKRKQVQELELSNQRLERENEKLNARIDRLSHDPEALELEIRDRLKTVRPGETMYLLEDHK